MESAESIVSVALDEEQDCLDNVPESLQDTDRYEKMELAVEKLEEAIESIDEAKESIEEAAL